MSFLTRFVGGRPSGAHLSRKNIYLPCSGEANKEKLGGLWPDVAHGNETVLKLSFSLVSLGCVFLLTHWQRLYGKLDHGNLVEAGGLPCNVACFNIII